MVTGEVDYLICFDFPEADEPVFAGHKGLGYAKTMDEAARFETWEEAERVLDANYGPSDSTAFWGAVVEANR